MPSVFYAIYDDSATKIPFKMMHRSPYTIYRTSNMELIEEVSAMGIEPKAVLLEEDIASMKTGAYSSDDVSADEMTFLKETIESWSWSPEG